jgi:hypothetical protein
MGVTPSRQGKKQLNNKQKQQNSNIQANAKAVQNIRQKVTKQQRPKKEQNASKTATKVDKISLQKAIEQATKSKSGLETNLPNKDMDKKDKEVPEDVLKAILEDKK